MSLSPDIALLPPNAQDRFYITVQRIKKLGIDRNVHIFYMSLYFPSFLINNPYPILCFFLNRAL